MGAKMKRVKYIYPEEMNKKLAEQEGKILTFRTPKTDDVNNFKQMSYLHDGMVQFSLTCYDTESSKVTKYICYKDGREVIPSISGSVAYQTLCKYYPIKDLLEGLDDQTILNNFPSASPLIGFNPEYSGTRQEAWGYDLNSAYAKAMTSIWIDTNKRPKIKEIVPGKEIGFRTGIAANGQDIWRIQREGFCNMVFPLAPVPDDIKRFVDVWYRRKKEATCPEEKKKAKDMLNLCVGYLQRKNPFLRLLIVCYCNEYIESLLDENTLFYNTDSIVSRVRRPDLEANLGKDVGQWKIEHEGVVAYRGNTYQWNDDKPTWRGIPKTWFKDGYDLLTDGIPDNGNGWVYNRKTRQLEAQYGDIR